MTLREEQAKERFTTQWTQHVNEVKAIGWQLMDTPEYQELQDLTARLNELVVIASKGVKRIG